jgi:tetratricopeptide (TPR) repeat protein
MMGKNNLTVLLAWVTLSISLTVCSGCASRADEGAIRKGQALGKSGKYDEAIVEFNKALARRPSVEGYIARGATYAAKGDLDKAIADFSGAIMLNPNYAEAYTSRGLAYAYRGDMNQGIADCNKAVEVRPDYGAGYSTRAIIYFMQKKYDRSWADVQLAESLGYKVNPRFLEELKRASGREK